MIFHKPILLQGAFLKTMRSLLILNDPFWVFRCISSINSWLLLLGASEISIKVSFDVRGIQVFIISSSGASPANCSMPDQDGPLCPEFIGVYVYNLLFGSAKSSTFAN